MPQEKGDAEMKLEEKSILPLDVPEWLLQQTADKMEDQWKRQGCCEIYPASWKETDQTPPILLFSLKECANVSTAAILNLCRAAKKCKGLCFLAAVGEREAEPALKTLFDAVDGWLFWKAQNGKEGALLEQTAEFLKRLVTPGKNSFVGLAQEELFWIFEKAGRLQLAKGMGATPQQAAESILQQTDLRNVSRTAIHTYGSAQVSLQKHQNAIKCLMQNANPSEEGVWQLTLEEDLSGDESCIELLFGESTMKGE